MKPTQVLCKVSRRLPLTTKQAGRGYYKGNRVGSMGWHTKHGGFIIDRTKVRTYKVPAMLATFKLTPFVTRRMEPLKGSFKQGKDPLTGAWYLDRWREEGGGL